MSTLQKVAILQEAVKLLKTHNWIKGTLATDDGGNCVDIKDATATCFCAEGAITRARWELLMKGVVRNTLSSTHVINEVEDYLKVEILAEWNDNVYRTKEEVVKAFEGTIKELL